MPTDRLLATISELAARYFNGWQPKAVGVRRFPAFEDVVRTAMDCEREGEGS